MLVFKVATQFIPVAGEVPPRLFSVDSMLGLCAPPRLTTHGGSRMSVIRLHAVRCPPPRWLLVLSWPVETHLAAPLKRRVVAARFGTVLKSPASRGRVTPVVL